MKINQLNIGFDLLDKISKKSFVRIKCLSINLNQLQIISFSTSLESIRDTDILKFQHLVKIFSLQDRSGPQAIGCQPLECGGFCSVFYSQGTIS